MKNQENLESLLEKGIITQEEFDHIQNNRNSTTHSVRENILPLLKKGIITQEEFDHIHNNRNSTTRSVGENILSFIATTFAIISILVGTCVLNLGIVTSSKSETAGLSQSKGLILILSIVWVLFPFILFKRLSHKSNDTGMKWAAYTWLIIAFFIAYNLFYG